MSGREGQISSDGLGVSEVKMNFKKKTNEGDSNYDARKII